MPFALGLALAICFIPGVTGASIPTQWALLSAVLPLSLWRSGLITPLHWLWVGFISWSIGIAADVANLYTAFLGLWFVSIWALSFWLGSTLPSLAQLWKGLAIGLSISSLVAMAQALGYHPVEIADCTPTCIPGLLFNSTMQGATIALVLIALVSHRLWLWIGLLPVGLILANSRGAYLILAATALTRIHWLAAIAALILGALVFSLFLNPSDSQRLQVWGYAIRGLTSVGWGPFAFNDIYFSWRGQLTHAEFVHNDYLQLWFEFGIGALALYAIFGMALAQTNALDWPVAFAFALLAAFYFPLYTPLTAFIGCVVAGHLSRDWAAGSDLSNRWRSRLLSWHTLASTGLNRSRRHAIPILPRTSSSEA